MRKLKPGADMPEKSPSNMMFFERMEPKILLSADALAGLVSADPFGTEGTASSTLDIADSADFLKSTYDSTAEQSVEESSQKLDILAGLFSDNPAENEPSASPDVLVSLLEETVDNEKPQEIIFVDTGTPDYQELIDGITDAHSTHYQVFLLQSNHDGIEQISQVLAEQHGINAVHLISHGDATGLQLGDTWLSTQNLGNYAEQIKQWQTVLSADADLLIYGCDLASEQSGQALINTLAELSGADVAASDDLTGAVSLGGDWQLEYQTGEIESGIAIDEYNQQLWNNVLGTINVTTTNDVLDADADLSSLTNLFITPGSDGEVSLREAILAANTDIGFDEIYLGAATYDITIDTGGSDDTGIEGDLDITDSLAIRGVSEAATVIDGVGVLERTFDVFANNVIMSDLTITLGGSSVSLGGAMRVGSGFDASLTDVTLSNNYSQDGGGIYNDQGTLNLNRVNFISNTNTYNDGGAIYNKLGTVNISDSFFNGNLAENEGGAIYNNLGTVNLTRVDFTGNDASGPGAALGNGGAILNLGGVISGTDVIFTNNHADLDGGAIDNSGIVTLDQVLFFGNDTQNDFGGAINNDAGTVNLVNATFSANIADDDGGAIYNIGGGTLNITNATFSGNTVVDLVGARGISQDSTSTLNIKNTLLNDGFGNILGGIINSLGYNIDVDGTTLDKDLNQAFVATGDQVGSVGTPLNTLLDVLADNGGFSKTHALLAGSVAINTGTNTGAPLIDQRGYFKTDTSDIGAFELGANAPNNAPTATNLTTTSNYNEGDASVAITDIVVSDADAGEIITASLTLTDTAFGGLSNNDGASYDGVTGIWTITDTVVNVNTALANLVFTPNTNTDVNTSISVDIDDGNEDGGGALTGTISLNVTAVQDAPTATNLTSTSNYNEGDASVAITDIVVSDADTGEIITANLTLTDTAFGSLSNNDGASYDAITGIWTITDTVVNVNTALANLVFTPNTNTEVNTSISVDIDDGNEDGGAALTGTISLNVTAVQDAPTATNLTSTSNYNEGDASVAITDIVVSDADAGEIITANLTLTDTAFGSLSNNDGASYDGITGIWTITGTVVNVNTALANLVFTPNTNTDVNTSISVDIDDGNEDGGTALTGTISLNVTAAQDAPTATNLTSTSSYNEGDASVAITDIVVSDADAGEIITANLTLADTAFGSLSNNNGASYDAITGIWTITDTVVNVNTALANLVFSPNTNTEVNTSISVNIDDGNEDGGAALTGTISLNVTAVQDAPTATNLTSTSNYNEGDASVAITDIVVSDADTGEIITASLTLTDTAFGSLSNNDGASYDGVTGIWTITGTVVNVNTALANLVFTPNTNTDVNTSISVDIDDGNEDGGGALTGTISLNVTAAQDAPTATNLTSTSSYNEGDASVAITDIVVSDADAGEIITANLTLTDTAFGSLSNNDGASYDGFTGIWTITGTVINVNTALANLVFSPNTNTEVNTSISVDIDDGNEDGGATLTGTISLNVTAAQDAPTATNLTSTSSYNEGDASVAITDIVVSDADAGEIITANLTLTDTAFGSLSNNNGASYDAITGIWTITDTVVNVNTALANLVFTPNTNTDVNTSISVDIDDGNEDGGTALTGTISLNVTPIDDAPVVTNINSSVSFNHGDSSVPLNDIIITDVDSGEILTATLTLSNINAGSLSANDGASYDAATGVWTITGSIANVNLALANISFIPADSNPQDAVVSVSIDDGSALSSGPILGSLNITINPYTELLSALSSDPAADNSAEANSDNSVTSEVTEPTEEKAIEETTEAQIDVDSVDINRTSSIDVSPVLNERQNEIHFDQTNVIDTVALPDKDKVTVKSGSIESTVIRLREQMIAFNDPLNLIGTESFLLKLNDLREELILENENTEKVIGGSLTVSAGFSVGYVVWLARSGALMSSLLTSLPAWRFVDPLPILASLQYKELVDDEESLESIVREQK